MKILITIVLTLAAAVMFGCQSNSSRGGTSLKGEGFRIAAPTFATEIKQGEMKNVNISMTRDDFFKQDVKMQIDASKGVNVEPSSFIIKANDIPNMQLMVTADKDAAIGQYRVTVMGTPKVGQSTSTEFNVKVVAP